MIQTFVQRVEDGVKKQEAALAKTQNLTYTNTQQKDMKVAETQTAVRKRGARR